MAVVVFRGFGILTLFLPAIVIFALSQLLPKAEFGSYAGWAFLLSALLLGALGYWLNTAKPRADRATWAARRHQELAQLVQQGHFSLGPRHPRPSSVAEAQAQASALFEAERAAITRGRYASGVHTLFWIRMEYWAVVMGVAATGILISQLVG